MMLNMIVRRTLLLVALLALVLSGCKNTTPEITSPLIATGTIGQSFTYRIKAKGDPTSFTATGLPSGLSLNGSTGIISGFPTVAGTKNVTLSATNYGGRTGTAVLAVTIVNGTITPGLDVSILVGDGVPTSETAPANRRIAAFDDMTGFGWETLAGPPGNEISFPYSVFSDRLGRIYHVDTNKNRVARVDNMSGSGFVAFGSFGTSTGNFNKPSGIFVDRSDRIYIADTENHRIVRIDDMNGSGWTTLGSLGTTVGRFNLPFQLAVDAIGRVYVSDTGNRRVVRCDDMTGTGWVSLGSAGSGERQFMAPIGIAVDPLFRIYVADLGNNRIIRMADMDGNTWTALGSTGSGALQFDHPRGLYVSHSGRIYVADAYNKRIVRVNDMAGGGWTTFGTDGLGVNQFTNPCGVFVIESPYAVGMIKPVANAAQADGG
jgi:sugar lactone lactonase YvrE